MRRPLLLTALATLLLASSSFFTFTHAQPAPGAQVTGTNPMCLLDGLALTDGLSLSSSFQQQKFTYGCSSSDWTAISNNGGPKVYAHTQDWGSHVQVWFNGQAVNTKDKGNEMTNSYPYSLSLATPSNPWKGGNNKIQILVKCSIEPDYPINSCEFQYIINCFKPTEGNPGTVVGDPQFVGLRGQEYQVHGVAGSIYNIVSDPEVQYNSRFVFLDKGDCPIINGRRQKGCFSHPGSYLGELGLKTNAGDRIHLVTGKAAHGFESVSVNGEEVKEGETILLSEGMGSVSRNNTHLASVLVGNWDFVFENSDLFVNQRVRVLDARNLRSHGLLGQTWREITYPNAVKYIQGEVDDYVIREEELWGDNFLYNVFN